MRLALSRFCAFLLVLTVALPWVHAGDDETPAPKKDEPAPKAEPAPRGEVRPAPAPPGGMTRKDIEELVRRGGRLPEGFIPHGWRFDEGDGPKKPTGSIHRDMPFPMPGGGAMEGALAQATGKLILKYLEEKDDPARAAIYEELLREIGKALAEGKGETFAAHVPRVMGRLMGGLADPKKAPVYREIMKIFGEAMAGGLTAPQEPADPPRPPPIISGLGSPVTPPPGAPPAPSAPRGPHAERPLAAKLAGNWPASFVGAELILVGSDDPKTPFQVYTRRVPKGSLAHQAGIKPGDLILAIDGKPVTPTTLRQAEKAFTPGGKLQLKLRRMDGSTEVLDLEFEADDEPTDDKK